MSMGPVRPGRGVFNSAWHDLLVTAAPDHVRLALLKRGFALEHSTLAWNVVGVVVLAIAAISARSVALAGFGLDSLMEIGASIVVVWELAGSGEERQWRALRLIGAAFTVLALYLLVKSTIVLSIGYHPKHPILGIAAPAPARSRSRTFHSSAHSPRSIRELRAACAVHAPSGLAVTPSRCT